MKFTTELVEEAKQIAGKGALVRVTPDRRILHVQPASPEAAAEILKLSSREKIVVKTRLFPFGAEELAQFEYRILRLDLTKLSGIIEHSPEDFVVKVHAGTNFATLQNALAAAGQWLPIDPPGENALTVGEVVAKNEFGPRRTGYGTIRDYLIGATIVTPSGTLLKTGGPVVKSATGYDLHRLQIGALESLAVGLNFTFRLRAKPAAAATIVIESEDRGTAIEKALRTRDLPDAPAALFILSNLEQPTRLVVRYEGSAAAVDVAVERARPVLGPNRVEPSVGEKLLFDAREAGLEPGFRTSGRPPLTLRIGCRPSRMLLSLHTATLLLEKYHKTVAACAHPSLATADLWIPRPDGVDPRMILNEARAELTKIGGGSVRLRRPFEAHGGDADPSVDAVSLTIMERLKNLADPHHLLNPGILPFPARAADFAPDVPLPEPAPAAPAAPAAGH